MTESGRGVLEAMFVEAARQDRAVLLPYLTAGIPDVDTSVDLFLAMAEAGADGFEVGIPYADPLMDGPVIMEAGERALDRGVTVDVAFDIVTRIIECTGKPVLVMTYVNPVLRQGIGQFFDKAGSAGASGMIIADLPADEAGPFLEAAEASGVGLVLFAAPTTDDARLARVLESDPVFVYAIAEIGVTGERDRASSNIAELARRIRMYGDVPVVFGVGISSANHVAHAARYGDGVIVGTAVVRRVLEAHSASDAAAELREFIEGLVPALHRD